MGDLDLAEYARSLVDAQPFAKHDVKRRLLQDLHVLRDFHSHKKGRAWCTEAYQKFEHNGKELCEYEDSPGFKDYIATRRSVSGAESMNVLHAEAAATRGALRNFKPKADAMLETKEVSSVARESTLERQTEDLHKDDDAKVEEELHSGGSNASEERTNAWLESQTILQADQDLEENLLPAEEQITATDLAVDSEPALVNHKEWVLSTGKDVGEIIRQACETVPKKFQKTCLMYAGVDPIRAEEAIEHLATGGAPGVVSYLLKHTKNASRIDGLNKDVQNVFCSSS
ncbi:hypothetical protein HDU86_004340 [Geranomyces michiganensis]|nr:hypothetical protein HDU86_004340 [Geranomyces michiganensis]